MALETVRVAFLRDEVPPSPIDGIAVRVFDAQGQLVTTAQSGAVEAGVATFELEGTLAGTVYQIRSFLLGSSIPPKQIQVYSPASGAPTGTNDFLLGVQTFTLEPAVDPRMCRCSGILLGPNGKPRRGIQLEFWPQFGAFVSHPAVTISGRFLGMTDQNGFVSVDLYRYGIYEVSIKAPDEVRRVVQVPDRASVLLSHLLFPAVVAVGYTPLPPFAVAVDATLEVVPRVLTTDFRDLSAGFEDVLYTVDDPSVASVQLLSDRILIRGNAAGTTTLRVTRRDNSAVYIPDFGIAGGSSTITVT